jgi:hypothetical protein
MSVLVIVFGIYWGVRIAFFTPAPPVQLAQQSGAAPTPLVDTDNDGLPDSYEVEYRTDPQRADTDGDTVSDREEISRGTDPTIPAPNDVIKPITGEAAGQVAGVQTYTQQYLATLPADAAREDILDQTRLEAFIALNRPELLPTLPGGAVQTTTDAGAEAIQTYLDTISPSHNKQMHQVTNDTLEAAFNAKLKINLEPLNTIVTQLEQNIKVLKTIPAPAEVVDMHEKLIRATIALHQNVTQLRDIDQDFVGFVLPGRSVCNIFPCHTGLYLLG